MKKFLRMVFFLILVFLLFCRVNYVLGLKNDENKKTYYDFYKMPKKTLDIIAIGASSTYRFIIPSIIYNKTGIRIFDLANSNQFFGAIKNLIIECEKTQDPKLYIVDIRALSSAYLEFDVKLRQTCDLMNFSKNRFNMIKYIIETEKKYYSKMKWDNYFEYIFSFVKYHTRWDSLTKGDFNRNKVKNNFLGFVIDDNYSVKKVKNNEKIVKNNFKIKSATPSEVNMRFLSDFMDFCDGFDKEIVFIRTPTCENANIFAIHNYAQQYIEKRGYKVWNLNDYVDEIKIDYDSDFYDNRHVNLYGALKVSNYIANRIKNEYNFMFKKKGFYNMKRKDIFSFILNKNEKKIYEEVEKKFNNKLNQLELKITKEFNKYFDYILKLNKKRYTILISVKGTQGNYLDKEHIQKLKKLGLKKVEMLLDKEPHSYIAVISNGKVISEKIGKNEWTSNYENIVNGQTIKLISGVSSEENISSIKLGPTEYSKNGRGFNIVIIDNEEKGILDNVTFDTNVKSIPCKR